jgi:hypothetical protein
VTPLTRSATGSSLKIVATTADFSASQVRFIVPVPDSPEIAPAPCIVTLPVTSTEPPGQETKAQGVPEPSSTLPEKEEQKKKKKGLMCRLRGWMASRKDRPSKPRTSHK